MATPFAKIFVDDPINGYITIFMDGEQHTIRASASNYEKAKSFYLSQNWDELLFEMNPSLRFQSLYAKYEAVEVKDGQVFVNGETIREVDAKRILGFMAQGEDCVPIFKFITRLQNNPSKRAVDELYKFLFHKNLPLTDSGTFLAYKAVREDYTDKHTGKFYNGVGEVLEMPRNKVDDDKTRGCSYGFHAGTLQYAVDFMSGHGHLMVVEIDPADVVSIPEDCEFQKLRTCKYKVNCEYAGALDEFKVYPSEYPTKYDDDIDRQWEDDEDDDETQTCSGCDWDCEKFCKCGYCYDCCECETDDDDDDDDDSVGCMGDPDGEKIEIQQVFEFDESLKNKVQNDWKGVVVKVDSVVGWMCGKQHIHIGMAIRKAESDTIRFGDILKYTSEDVALDCYRALNK